jgi:hypothetical protein
MGGGPKRAQAKVIRSSRRGQVLGISVSPPNAARIAGSAFVALQPLSDEVLSHPASTALIRSEMRVYSIFIKTVAIASKQFLQEAAEVAEKLAGHAPLRSSVTSFKSD